MKNNQKLFPLLIALFMFLAAPAIGLCGEQEQGKTGKIDVDFIVKKTSHVAYYQGKDGRADVTMVITDSQGRKRKRRFTILRWDATDDNDAASLGSGDQKFYVYFRYPADVSKMAYLVWKHVDRDDDRWLYLPALDLVKRIAATDKRTSFAGSDFYYEDVSGRSIYEDKHELVKVTDNYYVLKNIPKDPSSVEFASFTMWIHKKTFIPVKIVYTDPQGNDYRVYEVLKVENIEGYPTVTQARMSDLQSGSTTVVKYNKVDYNIGLPESIFSERYLRNPPVSYMR